MSIRLNVCVNNSYHKLLNENQSEEVLQNCFRLLVQLVIDQQAEQ